MAKGQVIKNKLKIEDLNNAGNDIFDVTGTKGKLLSITDSLDGVLLSIADISGIPVFEVNSSGVSAFTGPVKGVKAINDDEFVTREQVKGTARGEWKYATSTSGDPGLKSWATNNADTGAATSLMLSNTTNDGGDARLIFSLVGAGFKMLLQKISDSTMYQQYEFTGVGVDSGTYTTFPVTHIAKGATPFTDKTVTAGLLIGGSAAGASSGATTFVGLSDTLNTLSKHEVLTSNEAGDKIISESIQSLLTGNTINNKKVADFIPVAIPPQGMNFAPLGDIEPVAEDITTTVHTGVVSFSGGVIIITMEGSCPLSHVLIRKHTVQGTASLGTYDLTKVVTFILIEIDGSSDFNDLIYVNPNYTDIVEGELIATGYPYSDAGDMSGIYGIADGASLKVSVSVGRIVTTNISGLESVVVSKEITANSPKPVSIWAGTQVEYDAITTKNITTLYFII